MHIWRFIANFTILTETIFVIFYDNRLWPKLEKDIPKTLYLRAKASLLRLKGKGMIRRATTADIGQIINLLHQVNMVHYHIRPDLFKPHTTKYNELELSKMLTDNSKPIFVFDDGGVLGYAFCQITEVQNNKLLHIIHYNCITNVFFEP